jgi:glutaredoxin 2
VPRVIAYTYEADVHCPACTQARHFKGGFKIDLDLHCEMAKTTCTVDEHQVPYCATDREGSLIQPVFSTDENDFTHCGDCHEPL